MIDHEAERARSRCGVRTEGSWEEPSPFSSCLPLVSCHSTEMFEHLCAGHCSKDQAPALSNADKV